MPAELQPLKKFPCTFEGCALSFDTEKAMKKHKKTSTEHDYCAKCDLDFDCWDDLVAHKADRSSDAHISCLYCGEDFKTESGRARHIRQNHPTDQELPCIGCGKVFGRAAALIDHLERGVCKAVSSEQFAGHLQHKNIIKRILENPDLMPPNLNGTALIQDNEDGGVTLGTLNESGGGSQVSGSPTGDENVFQGRMREKGRDFSVSSSKSQNTVASLGSKLSELSFTHEQGGAGSSDKGKGKSGPSSTYSQSNKASPNHTATSTTAAATPNGTGENANGGVWGSSSSAKLFSGAKTTPVTADWAAALQARDEAADRTSGLNMFRTRFWDPRSKDYDPERFFNPVIDKYLCPFPHCEHKSDMPIDLERHIIMHHRATQVRCPACLKLFKSTAALVAHCEAPNGRCRIAETADFGKAIDEFSGGFLNAYETQRPDDSDVTFVKYESWTPPDWGR